MKKKTKNTPKQVSALLTIPREVRLKKIEATATTKSLHKEQTHMSTIVINGLAYSGKTVEVRNGRVLVDGKEAPAGEGKDIHIEVTGDIKNLRVDACAEVSVSGNCGEISVQSGDVKCGDVSGSVSTQSGDIRCGRVAGNVRTMAGDIMKR